MADKDQKNKTATPAAKPTTAATRTTPAARTAQPAKPAAKPATAATRTAPAARTAQPAKPAATATRTVPPPKANIAAAQTAKPAARSSSATAKKPSAATRQQQKKNAPAAKSSVGGFVAGVWQNKKTRIAAIAILSFLVLSLLILSIALGARSCGKGTGNNGNHLNPGGDGNTDIGGDGGSIGNGTITIPVPDRGAYNLGSQIKPYDPYDDISTGTETKFTPDQIQKYPYNTDKKGTTAVGYSNQTIGTVERNIPQNSRDEGLGVYPKFGYTLSTVIGSSEENIAARKALIAESSYLTATGTWNAGGGNYKWMDKDGYLYNGTTADPQPTLDKYGKHRRIYKHSASAGLYMGDVSPDEPGIIKSVTMRPRAYTRGYGVTGVYAPAGEVIKIQMSEADMNATGGIVIHIGQALYNGKANNIWVEKGQMQRIPHLLNTMVVDKSTATLENGVYTAYVGSFIGGPLYIRNETVTFTATVSGGVAYSHFILGYTTQEEYEKNARSSAPYFDMEVWDNGVLHSGPKYYARNLSYDDAYKAAVLWDKVASVTTTGSTQGIVFLYEPFVAAGAAVAFPGQGSVNCPAGWMSNSLNYNTIVSSGAWGNFHEYHHNFQGYGVGAGGEVTNNGMTLVSYALFTKISANRGIASYGGAGLGGWNSYTSATWALNDVLKIAKPDENPSNGNKGLSLYATLLHNFGPDAYIQAKVQQLSHSYGENYQGYLRAWQDITHQDMTYYFKDILKGLDETTAAKWRNPDYPTFVPVSSVYQTGRTYTYDGVKKEITTMQPYVIPYTDSFTVDLSPYTAPNGQYASGSVILPDGFSYTVKNVATPEHGTVSDIDKTAKTFVYHPDAAHARSGKIVVTLGITKTDGNIVTNRIDDVDLILEFEQSHETNKATLRRTTYTYNANTMYTDAQTAFESNYAGYTGAPVTYDHSNPVQNCNTDIWFYPDNDDNHTAHPNAPDWHFVRNNTVDELQGKLYFEAAGKYRIYLRGRTNAAVYYSLDNGQTYTLGAKITSGNTSNFRPNEPDSYFDLELPEHSWVYVKEVLIVQSSPSVSFIGLGTAQWTQPMFTITTDEDGTLHYFDYQGNEVTEEEANNAAPIPPTKASYVNAYRPDYEFPDNAGFETEYFYTRKYNYTYSVKHNNLSQSVVGDPQCPSNFPIENLFDNDLTTSCSSPAIVSADKPWEITVDLGKVITANKFTLTGRLNNGAGNQNQTPKSFTLYVGNTPETLQELFTVENGTVSGITIQQAFERTSFRYYKIVVRQTVQGRFAAIANIEFSDNIPNGNLITPDHDMFTYTGNWSGLQTNATFGHIYVGQSGATVSFTFTGTRLALLSSFAEGTDFTVTIDGRVVPSIELKDDQNPYGVSYISSELSNGSHSVTVKCNTKANIDSVVIYA